MFKVKQVYCFSIDCDLTSPKYLSSKEHHLLALSVGSCYMFPCSVSGLRAALHLAQFRIQSPVCHLSLFLNVPALLVWGGEPFDQIFFQVRVHRRCSVGGLSGEEMERRCSVSNDINVIGVFDFKLCLPLPFGNIFHLQLGGGVKKEAVKSET